MRHRSPNLRMPLRASLSSLLLVLAVSCGLEVGNPTKPVIPTTEDQKTLAEVVTDQLEETLFASSSGQNTDSQTLNLAARKCEVVEPGTVQITIDNNSTQTNQLPVKAPKRSVVANTTAHALNTFKTTVKGLGCGPAGLYPSFNYKVLTQYTVERSSNRETSKVFTDIATGALNETITVKAEALRKESWLRVSYDAAAVVLRQIVNFETNLQRTSVKGEVVTPYVSHIQTKQPLSILQTNLTGGKKSYVIESGKVVSNFQTSQKLLIEYENVSYKDKVSCTPQSGIIRGKVFLDEALTQLNFSFDVIFLDGSSYIQYSDGSIQELDLVTCSFAD